MKKILLALVQLTLDAVDPVCQNRNAVIMGKYRGYLVRMRPVITGSRVTAWVPDKAESDQIDAALEARAAARREKATRAQPLMQGQDAPPMAQPPQLPPQFNPGEVPGL